jgi:2-isopropylmalate synthase
MLPDEFSDFISDVYESVPMLSSVSVGISSSNTISMADASAIAAIARGASQISAAAYPIDNISLPNIAKILSAKADTLGACFKIRTTQLTRITDQIAWLCQSGKTKPALYSPSESADGDLYLTYHDSLEAVSGAVKRLGYDLSDDDYLKVFGAFKSIAEKKERVSFKELDAIVASSAMQVPSTYKLDTYVITSGNTISATAHIKLTKNGTPTEGVYIGDGSIDAAFQAIEKITGCHCELDDFELQAVTEGREAMGQTVVKLRSGGKVYSGRGISTDIVGAGIQAYLSALNKIIYEEEME